MFILVSYKEEKINSKSIRYIEASPTPISNREREFESVEYLIKVKWTNKINKGNLKSKVFPSIVDKFVRKGSRFDPKQIKEKYYSLQSEIHEYNHMRFMGNQCQMRSYPKESDHWWR